MFLIPPETVGNSSRMSFVRLTLMILKNIAPHKRWNRETEQAAFFGGYHSGNDHLKTLPKKNNFIYN
jgi:hypothetical protein